MSDLIFPTLRGLTYPVSKIPNWSTITQRSMTGIPKFLQQYTYPFYDFKLSFNYLIDKNSQTDDIHALMGFYNRVGGGAQSFLFADETDNSVTKQLFGKGDGSTTKFQLCRNYGGFIEPVFGLATAPKIYINDTEITNFTWTSTGQIALTTVPTPDSLLAWSGDFYYRCHFKNDTSEFSNIYYQIWELQELELQSVKM